MDDDTEDMTGRKPGITTRSKTGSLQPRTFNMEDLKRRSTTIASKELERFDKKKDDISTDKILGDTRLTRLKAQQIASGTLLFKLGMENQYKTYVNQYSTNSIALNKLQKNEERDKKRHMSHKFSLTQAAEFKWVGSVYGSRSQLVSTLRNTLLQLESNIPSAFMHINWSQLRKPWTAAVTACNNARDFARAMIVFQACVKPVVYAAVWHDQLGKFKFHFFFLFPTNHLRDLLILLFPIDLVSTSYVYSEGLLWRIVYVIMQLRVLFHNVQIQK